MVEFQRDGGGARIFLNRPQKVNALDSAMLGVLAAAILPVDDGVRVAARGTRFAMPEARLGAEDVDRAVSPALDSLLAGDADAEGAVTGLGGALLAGVYNR